MRERTPDELAFIFHLDYRLAERTNTFRFSVLLEGEPSGTGAVPKHPLWQSRAMRTAAVIWCKPENGNPQQNVRGGSGAPGFICALGSATIDDEDPDCIYGQVYADMYGIPDQPPSGAAQAQLVNFGSHPDFPPPAGCGHINFVFHHAFNRELGGAAHNSAGDAQNFIALWVERGSVCSRPVIQPFRGMTHTQTQCGGGYGPPPTIAANSPAQYRLSLSAPFLSSQAALILRRCDQESTAGELAFKSCAQAYPEAQWCLWITTKGGQPHGTLALLSIYRTKLEAPMIWKSGSWDLRGVNQLVLDSPSEYTEAVPSITIEPAPEAA